MAIKEMAYLTPAVVLQKIRDIVSGEATPISATCRNYVGLYLKAHPNTVGHILLYTSPGPGNSVAHAMLIDARDKTLMDSLKGWRLLKNRVYLRTDGQEYDLVATVSWPQQTIKNYEIKSGRTQAHYRIIAQKRQQEKI